jgi:uncharacterized membrane protein
VTRPWPRALAAYIATVLALLALDALWLGLLAPGLYERGIGHLMAAQPRLAPAAVFYLVYAWGLQLFAVAPERAPAPWPRTLSRAAAFGLCAYATYDLSNLATLRDWPVWLAVVDIVWGCLISMAAAAAGKAVRDRMEQTRF